MENIIVLTLAYVLFVALIHAPKCPALTATETAPIDYFPEVETVESLEKTDSEPTKPLPIKVSEPIKTDTVTETAIAPAPSPITSPDLKSLTIRQLKAMAKGKIKNYSNLTKAQLIDRLSFC